MDDKPSKLVAGVKLRLDKPTNVAMRSLYGWVIWQFPVPQKKGFQAAVRPPLADHAWLPAIVRADKNRVKIYGHIDEQYASPDAALAYFKELNNG
jgi:hypothetical protein